MALGLSQERVTELAGSTNKNYGEQLEARPTRKVSPAEVVKLAEVLQTTIEYLIVGAPPGVPAEVEEFAAEMRVVGARLDARGRRAVVAVARQQLAELTADEPALEAPGGFIQEQQPAVTTRQRRGQRASG